MLPLLFINCEKKTTFENRAYYTDNVLVLELNYHDLPAKDRIMNINDIYLKFENDRINVVSPIIEKDLVVFEYREESLKIQFFNLDFCPYELIFTFTPHRSFIIYLNSDDPNNIGIRIRK